MRRTGLVWRPFNLIYGFGAVLLTLCLYRLRRKNDRWIFLGGALLGGGYEYLCSWLRETLLGTVSWDYSEIPFNLNGRVNLLYCFFWGILALVWVKELYPVCSNWIERHVSPKWGVPVTWALVLFMLANTVVSAAAVYRMSQRYEGVPAVQSWQVVLDEHYPDEKLAEIYPSMVRAEQLPER
ncbi:MAG: putative ABC transporter permease [Oscillospiraceae bacterium]|nr:putative ABC transporter permease [Oscillospiraceae bacterium]